MRKTHVTLDAQVPESRATPPISELLAEREGAGGWEYDAQFAFADGSLKRIALTLSWSDYQHWAPDGSLAPSRAADAVLHVIAQHFDQFEAMESIDASTVRRPVDRADNEIRAAMAR